MKFAIHYYLEKVVTARAEYTWDSNTQAIFIPFYSKKAVLIREFDLVKCRERVSNSNPEPVLCVHYSIAVVSFGNDPQVSVSKFYHEFVNTPIFRGSSINISGHSLFDRFRANDVVGHGGLPDRYNVIQFTA